MKKALVFIAVTIGCVLPVSGQAGNDRIIQEEIKRLNTVEVEGLMRNDVKALGALWSDDFVVTNPLNQFVNKQQVLGLIKSGVLAFTSYDRKVEYVRIYEGTAVVAGSEIVVWAGKMPNAGKTSHLRFTAIWMKQAGRWQEVARHANIFEEN
jgi:hypothetical protein